MKRMVISAAAMVLALFSASESGLPHVADTALAGSPEPYGELFPSAAAQSAFSYQGVLTDAAGTPLSGNYNLVFQLWDHATVGSQVGQDIPVNAVAVEDGLFSVEVPVNPTLVTGQGLWLRLHVDGEWLSPRQSLLPVPYALTLRPGASIQGNEALSGALIVDNGGGAPAIVANAGAILPDNPTTQIGVYGAGVDAGVIGFGGGLDSFGGAFDGNAGVRGAGQGGPGGEFVTVNGIGATAVSPNSWGLYAESGTVNPVVVLGKNAIVANGEEIGVWSVGGLTGGLFDGGHRGIVGRTDGLEEGGAGVFGESVGRLVDGVRGVGAHGIHGIGYTGVFGEGDVGVAGEGIVGVGGTSESGAGVVGESGEGIGVEGKSSNGYGVKGRSDFDHGVYGETGGGFAAGVSGHGPTGVFGTGGFVGVAGYTEGELGTGVQGTSTANRTKGVVGDAAGYGSTGVEGTAALGIGVVGSGEVGVQGTGSTGAGVEGEGSIGVNGAAIADGDGVMGYSPSGNGVFGSTGATYGLYTPDRIYTGKGCTGCNSVFIAVNDGDSDLRVGDVVAVSGVEAPLAGQTSPVMKVVRATAQSAVGVVQARGIPTERSERIRSGAGSTDSIETAVDILESPGRVSPGEHLFVVVQGMAQVRVDGSSGTIQPGDALALVGPQGMIQKAPAQPGSALTLGRALEPLDADSGLIWVLILGR